MTRLAAGAAAFSGAPSYTTLRPIEIAGDVDPGYPAHVVKNWSPIIDELLRIRSLNDDWDGEGSEAPHPGLVDGAIALVQTLQGKGVDPPDRVHASVNATVYFEWYAPWGYYEVEVISPTEAECRIVRKGTDQTDVFYFTRQQ